MTRDEYIRELSKYLRRLPKQDREDAVIYYQEYFDEAGEENFQTVIEELGNPKKLAKEITISCVEKRFDEEEEIWDIQENKKEKRNGNIGWLIFLAVMALPMSPVVLALILVLFLLIGCLFLGIGACIVSGAATFVMGGLSVIVGIVLLFIKPSNVLLVAGAGLCCLSLGILVFVGFINVWTCLKNGLIRWGRTIIQKKHIRKEGV